MRIFISYNSNDVVLARAISVGLQQQGIDVWLDQDELYPGDNWSMAIGEALSQADAMLVLLSGENAYSSNIEREVQYALGEPRFQGHLIPVIVEDSGVTRETLEPWILRKLHVVQVSRTDVDGGVRNIVEALAELPVV